MSLLGAFLIVAVLLLGILVAGLLRSHAEVLRDLHLASEYESLRSATPPRRTAHDGAKAADIGGTLLDGGAIRVDCGQASRPKLMAFLSSGCLICESFWKSLRDNDVPELPAGIQVVVVTKGSDYESRSRLRKLASENYLTVMSSAAWEDYKVPVAPYFVYVDGGKVVGEGSGSTWGQILSMLSDALEDMTLAGPQSFEDRRYVPRGPLSGRDRQERAEAALTAAGISFDDPSLYSPSPFEARPDPQEAP